MAGSPLPVSLPVFGALNRASVVVPTNIILVGAPRSGAQAIHAGLATSPTRGPSLLTTTPIIDETLDLPADRFESHRLVASDLTPDLGEAIRAAASSVDPGVSVAVDWQPRMSLRLGLLAEALPDARFLLVVRRPVPTIASLMEAWRSRRFASVQELEGWWGEPWAFPVIPGWADLIGAPPARVCSVQWAEITSAVLDDLESISSERWAVASYEGLLQDPGAELSGVAESLGLEWSGTMALPDVTPSAVTPPDETKWSRNGSEIATQTDVINPVAERLRAVASQKRPDLPWPELKQPERKPAAPTTMASDGTPFASVHTSSFAALLAQAGCSVLATTYKSGHAIIARSAEGKIDTEFTNIARPMGIASQGARLAIGASDCIMYFSNNANVAAQVPSTRRVDTAYAPRAVIFTGDVAIHDMAFGDDEQLYFINTRFSCLSRMDIHYSFDPVWRPEWISTLAAEDRCHLNGLAMRDGRPRYVTALARTDTAHGWRELKGTSGVIVDVTNNDVVTEGLSMPHSPRWHDNRLWVLESGKGTLGTVDLATGEVTTIAELPGFTRGLSFIGPYALVGLSQVRESVFTELPITSRSAERNCGVWAVDTRNGHIVGFLKFDGVVQEIFDVQLLPGTWPVFVDQGPLTENAFVVPDSVFRDLKDTGEPEASSNP